MPRPILPMVPLAGNLLTLPSRWLRHAFPMIMHVVVQSLSCVWLCNPMDCRTPSCPVLSDLPEFAQIHVHWVGDAIQPSHPQSPPSPAPQSFPAAGSFPMSWFLHQVAQVLELKLQHQSFPWIFRVDFLYDHTWSYSLSFSMKNNTHNEMNTVQ